MCLASFSNFLRYKRSAYNCAKEAQCLIAEDGNFFSPVCIVIVYFGRFVCLHHQRSLSLNACLIKAIDQFCNGHRLKLAATLFHVRRLMAV